MLEKIGLPAKPAVRGNNWVIDASHCQGCNSQFTFINRKHHCRRCGGLFCGSCTQQRMVLRGQGDLPVRICEPCKKLEEAARFEMRHRHKSRAGRGSSTSTSKYEDEVLNQILGSAREESFSSVQESNSDMVSGIKRATSSASRSNAPEGSAQDGGGEVQRSISLNEPNSFTSEMASASPEELRERALDEKKMYKILKGEGKLGEALKAFKRGKELERQAEAMEIYLRKMSKKVLSSGNMADIQNKYVPKESGRKNKIIPSAGKEKDDLAAELRELGWSDKDLRDEDKKLASTTLEGELSSLLGEVSQKTNINKSSPGIDKTEVVALKKKALMLKREGNLAEAKEELKRAKVLEKQLEEQELLAGAEDSDDELSELIRSMDDDKEKLSIQYEQEHNFDFGHIVGTSDDFIVDSNFDVTDEDMDDPEITAALQSLGWTEDSINHEKTSHEFVPIDREAKLREIQALKREALNQKRAGNVSEAMTKLKKAKVLERDLEDFESQADDSIVQSPMVTEKHSTFMSDDKFLNSATVDYEDINARKDVGSRVAPKSRLMIQKELLSLKKKALALRREGRLDEAEEELKKGKVLEHQLEHMDNALKVTATKVTVGIKDPDLSYKHPDVNKNISVGEGEGEEDVTDHDMHDPTYLSLLKNLGWTDADNELENSASKPSKHNVSVQITESSSTQSPSSIVVRSLRSRAELQKELLSLKRKGLALRRQGKTEEAEEVQWNANALEAQIAEIDAPKKEIQIESNRPKDKIFEPPAESSVEEGDEGDVTENDVQDPALLSILKNLGWKDDELEPVIMQEGTKQVAVSTLSTTDPSVIESSSGTPVAAPRSKGEIQRELLGLKRKALALRRKGEMEQVEETLRMAKVLEAQLEDMEVPKLKLVVNASEDERPEPSELLISSRNHGSLEGTVEVSKVSVAAVTGSNGQVVQSSVGLGGTETDPINPPSRNSDSISIFSESPEKNNPFSVELVASDKMSPPDNTKTAKYAGYNPPPGQSVNMVDLLTGDDWNYSQKPEEKKEDKLNLGSDELSPTCPAIHLGSVKSPEKDLGRKDHVTTTERETVHSDEKPNTYEANSAQEFPLQKVDSSLRQEILAHKRKAVALKREGNLREAREELRQAKLLEKSLEDNSQPKTGPSDVSSSDVPPFGRKEHGTSNLAPKPLSSRERVKLQQESLGHKRQALKLRREGRMEEAEAEFELAKAIEMQLDELAAHDSTVSSVSKLEPADDVVVEDLLDPQLLHALKAIGLEGANMVVPSVPERQQPSKVNAGRSENSNLERTQLEERIKTEKVKAVNLKRSGKQAEALDTLRHAKLLEKKLNSLASQ
ncbi:hypothetical protein F2P56_007340 [Juglans regia]|uniref:Uncharacterized protein LOC109002511 n=2 Tax=Juglans regia TaxID=51240 RepID=A0A2I4FW10_JUGRE|nr:uncharacterized protein LOC109002511 [Juglans regia]XP_035543924.1 uncharacterized protein LOC109002511 [Juglans regia]KAF5475542.1 hypothetical protein F2P56_007340 [Juglans regia]